jgi:hypothetical protein
MNKIIAIIFAVFSISAHAVDLEIGLGKTNHTTNAAYSIGIAGNLSENWRARLGYANIGTPSMDMNVSPADYADDLAAGWGTPPCHWLAPKPTKEIYGTLDPVIYRGSLTYRLEFGAALYRSQWQQDICQNWYNEGPHAYGNPINIAPILGIVVSGGRLDYAITFQDITGRGDWEGNNPGAERFTFSVRMAF